MSTLDPAALDEILAFRAARERRLHSEDGWLSLVARHLLLPGSNSVPLPSGDATADRRPDGSVALTLPDGRVHTWGPTDDGGPYVYVGTQRFELLRQSDKLAIRVRDPNAHARTAFTHMPVFEPSARFRVVAHLSGPEKIIPTVTGLGANVDERSPGTLHFTIDGAPYTLEPVIEADAPHRLFLNFKDLTNGADTYGAGRFLYTKLPDASGDVVVDFNQAYNPPCALTEHASCPIAPAANRLKVRIEAGEKTFVTH